MKKITRKALSLVLAALMLTSVCVACNGKPNLKKMTDAERADYMVDIIENVETTGVAIDMSMTLTGSMMGIAISAEMTGSTVYVGNDEVTAGKHDESTLTMTMKGNGVDEKQAYTTVSGFRDGKMYESKTEDGKTQALVSAISFADYTAHRERVANMSGEELTTALKLATTKTCVANQDGTWTSTLTDYPAEALETVSGEYFDDVTDLFADGYEIEDFILEIILNEEHLPLSLKIDAVYASEKQDADKDDMPVMSLTCTFRDYGTATLPEVDLSTYTEIADLATLKEVQKTLSNYRNQDAFSFTAENQTVTHYAGSSQTNKETDKVTVVPEDGKYTFDIKATIQSDSQKVEADVSYENGQLKISGKDVNTQTQSMEEAAARSYVQNLLDPAGLSSAQISKIEPATGSYTHVFTIADPDYSEYQEAFADYQTDNYDATATVSVYYENGILTRYQYEYELTFRVERREMKISVSSVVTFAQSPTTV